MTLSVILLACSALSVSVILLKNSSERTESARRAASFAAYLEEQIRYARRPIDEIKSSYPDGDVIFSCLEEDASSAGLIEAICTGDYASACDSARLLKKHTEEVERNVADEESKSRSVRAFLPLWVSALVLILLI